MSTVNHKPVTWAVGVTTVPERKEELLPRTLASLQAAGWESGCVRLSVDGCGFAEAAGYQRLDGNDHAVTVREPPRLLAWGNWYLALTELYVRNPLVHRYLMLQDDVEMYRNLRGYLDRQPFPKQGYWNLYSAFENEEQIAPLLQQGRAGWVEGTPLRDKNGEPHPRGLQRGRGALALVFSREGVQRVLGFAGTVAKPTHATKGTLNIDGAVVTAMNEQMPSWREYVHAPTLVHHLGLRSSIVRPTGQPNYPPARSWRGASFDALELLRLQGAVAPC